MASLLVMLLVLSWLTPLLALLIKIDSGCSPFFIQKRVGKGGRTFLCYKFRTMIRNREADEKPAAPDDPRITRIGGILRRFNIDELPQFVNVLAGSMSVVGPRPHMHADCCRFSSFIPGYRLRNFVKPGITGLAQVKGYHGPAADYDSMYKRYWYDLLYIRQAGPGMDIKIIWKTIVSFSSFSWHGRLK